jgi:hypothetical protein
VRPPLFIIILALTCGIAIATICAFCAVQPNKVAAYMRRKHLSSPRWLRNWPFAGMVMKEWYPVYLRVVGIGGFVCALVWLTLLIRIFSK